MCALRLSHSGALRTQWVDKSRVTKPQIISIIFIIIISQLLSIFLDKLTPGWPLRDFWFHNFFLPNLINIPTSIDEL